MSPLPADRLVFFPQLEFAMLQAVPLEEDNLASAATLRRIASALVPVPLDRRDEVPARPPRDDPAQAVQRLGCRTQPDRRAGVHAYLVAPARRLGLGLGRLVRVQRGDGKVLAVAAPGDGGLAGGIGGVRLRKGRG